MATGLRMSDFQAGSSMPYGMAIGYQAGVTVTAGTANTKMCQRCTYTVMIYYGANVPHDCPQCLWDWTCQFPPMPSYNQQISLKVESEEFIKEENKTMYKLGDRVRVTVDYAVAKEGLVGIIVNIYQNGKSYGIDFGVNIGGHDVDGCCPPGNGYYVPPTNLELIKENNMLQPLEAISNLIKRTLKPDAKALYRAGYLTSDLSVTTKLTDAAMEFFVGHMIDGDLEKCSFKTFADELVAQANEQIAEAEKKEKK